MSEHQLCIYTLGNVAVKKDGKALTPRTRKALGLLIYLCVEGAFQRGIKHPRSKLAELLWPGITLKSALENLRQAIYQIKQAIPQTANEESIILSNRQYIWTNPRVSYFLDLEPFLQDGQNLPPQAFEFPGEFLEHFFLSQNPEFDDWITQKRIQIKEMVSKSLQDQIKQAKEAQQWDQGLALARHAVNWSPESEFTHRSLAYFLAKSGKRLEAISTLREFERQISATYDTGLSPDSLKLMEELQASPSNTNESAQTLPTKKVSWITGAALGILLLLIGGYVFRSITTRPDTISSQRNNPSSHLLAVLPFENMYYDDQQDYLAEAMTDELITALTRYGDWQVISRTSVMRYQNTEKSLSEIAQELNVTHILEGSVQKNQDRIRLNVKLIDARKDVQIWANSYEREIKNMLALQAELSNEIAFRVSNMQPNKERDDYQAIDPKAYEYYLKGRILFFKKTPEAVDSSLYYFEKSLDIEPGYQDAHLQVANATVTLCSWWGEGLRHIDEEWSKVEYHLKQIEDNPIYRGEIHRVWGWAHLWNQDLPNAIDQLEKAVEFDPETEFALSGLALAYVYAGKYEDALRVVREAQALNPTNAHNYIAEGEAHCLLGDYNRAIAAFNTALQYDSKYKVAAIRKAWTYMVHKRYQPALNILDSLQQENNPVYFLDGHHTAALILNQQTSQAMEQIDKMIGLTKQGEMGYSYYIAMAYALLGEEEKALQWLEEMFIRKDPDGNWVYADPLMAPVRDNPRYQELIASYLPEL